MSFHKVDSFIYFSYSSRSVRQTQYVHSSNPSLSWHLQRNNHLREREGNAFHCSVPTSSSLSSFSSRFCGDSEEERGKEKDKGREKGREKDLWPTSAR